MLSCNANGSIVYDSPECHNKWNDPLPWLS